MPPGCGDRLRGRLETELGAPETEAVKIACEVFALHTEFLEYAEQSHISALSQTAEQLAEIPWRIAAPELEIHRLDPAELGTSRYSRIARHGRASRELSFDLCPPLASRAEAAKRSLDDGRKLLSKAAPQFAEEVETVLGEIFIAEQINHNQQTLQFEGLSSFRLWGSAIFHPNSLGRPVEAALELVHECTHALLFTACIDGALVRNTNDQRYPSPLRSDPRPMDGILHATIVLLRMLACLRGFAELRALDDENRDWVNQRQKDYVAASRRGLEELRRHARWTRRGEPIWRELERFALAII